MRLVAIIPAVALVACTIGPQPVETPFGSYLGSETRLLDDDLVNFQVKMQGQLAADSLSNYADCVAAQYTLVRGFTHARHLRTNVYEQGGIQVADAIYTISPTEPRGTKTIVAADKVTACVDEGIPTV